MHLVNEDCVCSKHNQEQLMHNLWFFYYFFQKSLFTENYFRIPVINLVSRGPLYTCLVQINSIPRILIQGNVFLPWVINAIQKIFTGITSILLASFTGVLASLLSKYSEKMLIFYGNFIQSQDPGNSCDVFKDSRSFSILIPNCIKVWFLEIFCYSPVQKCLE